MLIGYCNKGERDVDEILSVWHKKISTKLIPVEGLSREQQLKGCWIHQKSLSGDKRPSSKITLDKGVTGELRWEVGIAFLNNPDIADPTYQGSHLCHEPYCVRVDHLILEPQDVNLDRNNCSGPILASRGASDVIIVSTCEHDPPCINLREAKSYKQCQTASDPIDVPLFTKWKPLSTTVQNLLPPENRQVQ